MNCELEDKIFNLSPPDFDAISLEVFRFQYTHNPIYRQYADALHRTPADVREVYQIPFLPVSFFKQYGIKTGNFTPELIFESSGTTRTGNSRHFVKKASVYNRSFSAAFRHFYGSPTDWCIAGLLPSYLERGNSSLVLMAEELIRESGHPNSGFYLDNFDELMELLRANEQNGTKTLLLGVTFALLDLAERFHYPLQHTVVMETGGMKGRRREMVRQEVHDILQSAWQLPSVHSEYGMTELLSQGYSAGDGLFRCPHWMKVLIREEDDPLSVKRGWQIPEDSISKSEPHPPNAATDNGLVNVIDLANLYSCSFIATDDLGKRYADGSFEIIGRADASDIRGCSLMYA